MNKSFALVALVTFFAGSAVLAMDNPDFDKQDLIALSRTIKGNLANPNIPLNLEEKIFIKDVLVVAVGKGEQKVAYGIHKSINKRRAAEQRNHKNAFLANVGLRPAARRMLVLPPSNESLSSSSSRSSSSGSSE